MRCSLLRRLFGDRFAVLAEREVVRSPSAIIILMVTELLRSRSATRSMYLLNTLQYFPRHIPNKSPVLTELLEYVPGTNNGMKLLTCRIVLQRCIVGLSFGRFRNLDEDYDKFIQSTTALR